MFAFQNGIGRTLERATEWTDPVTLIFCQYFEISSHSPYPNPFIRIMRLPIGERIEGEYIQDFFALPYFPIAFLHQ